MVVIAAVMPCKQLNLCTNLKENLLQCVIHNLERKPTTHGNGYLVLVLLVILIVVVLLLPFISIVVVGKIVGTRALFRLEEPSAPETVLHLPKFKSI